jgi:hypothetical protein
MYRSIALFSVLAVVIATFSPLAYSAHAQDDMDIILSAYQERADWETYHGQVSSRLQTAFNLEVGELRFELADTIVRYFDADYVTDDQAAAGTLTETQTTRTSAGGRNANTFQSDLEVEVVGLAGDIYVRGQWSFASNEGTQSLTWDEFNALEDTQLESNAPRDMADFKEFRDLRLWLETLETSGVILEQNLVNIRQYPNDLIYYQVQVDALAGIDALNIDLAARFAAILENEIVAEDVFLQAVDENAELIVGVFIDPTNGQLVAENLSLLINLELAGEDLLTGDEDSGLSVDYAYEWSVLYSEVNTPLVIENPE